MTEENKKEYIKKHYDIVVKSFLNDTIVLQSKINGKKYIFNSVKSKGKLEDFYTYLVKEARELLIDSIIRN